MITPKVVDAYYVTSRDNVRRISVFSLHINEDAEWATGWDLGGQTIDVILDPSEDMDIEQRCKCIGAAAVITYGDYIQPRYMKVDEGEFAEYTNGHMYYSQPVCINRISKRDNRISISCGLLEQNCN